MELHQLLPLFRPQNSAQIINDCNGTNISRGERCNCSFECPAVHGFALDVKESRIESTHGRLLRFSQLSVFTILNLIGAEVLIKIKIATSHCLCAARNISLLSNCVQYISALGFMREQMITSE